MNFMISVLGSVVFWIGFFGIGVIAGSVCLKKLFPKSYEIIKTGKDHWGDKPCGVDYFHICMTILFTFTCWFFIAVYFVLKFLLSNLIKKVVWPVLCKIIVSSEKLVPDFKIVKEED